MKHQNTTHNHQYIVKYYRLDYFYPKEKLNYYDKYVTNYTVHSGCTTLLWQLKFNSLAKLRAYLKESYSDDYGITFSTNINSIIKGQKEINKRYFFVVSCPTMAQNDNLHITLKDRKKKNRFPKKSKRYCYDDMYNSGGQGIKNEIMERDHKQFHTY